MGVPTSQGRADDIQALKKRVVHCASVNTAAKSRAEKMMDWCDREAGMSRYIESLLVKGGLKVSLYRRTRKQAETLCTLAHSRWKSLSKVIRGWYPTDDRALVVEAHHNPQCCIITPLLQILSFLSFICSTSITTSCHLPP